MAVTEFKDVFVYNALDEEVSVKAAGNWFTFKPKQIKLMRGEIGGFLIEMRREDGLVDLPEEFTDPNYKNTPEGKAMLAQKTEEGTMAKIGALKLIEHNLLVSLRRDLDMADIKADVLTYASNGEIKALKDLKKYKDQSMAKDARKVEELQVLVNELKGIK